MPSTLKSPMSTPLYILFTKQGRFYEGSIRSDRHASLAYTCLLLVVPVFTIGCRPRAEGVYLTCIKVRPGHPPQGAAAEFIALHYLLSPCRQQEQDWPAWVLATMKEKVKCIMTCAYSRSPMAPRRCPFSARHHHEMSRVLHHHPSLRATSHASPPT